MINASQQVFADALLDPGRPVPAGLMSHTSRLPERRFAVYRNNVVVGLVEALRTKFPATVRIVGDEFFNAMAQVFVSSCPPRSKILHQYGDDFGDFIRDFGPAGELPYLADVARLEAARTRAYHAEDATSITGDDFTGIEQTAISALSLRLHPSMQLLRSSQPVVTVWSMNCGEMEPQPLTGFGAEDAMVVRPRFEVLVLRLRPGGFEFIESIREGFNLGDAVAFAMAHHPTFDLVANLADLIRAGAVTGFERN